MPLPTLKKINHKKETGGEWFWTRLSAKLTDFFWFWSFSFRLWEWLNVAGEHLFCPRVVDNLWGIGCCGCMSPQIMSLPSCLLFHLLYHPDPDQKSPLLKSSVQAKIQWHSGGIWFGMGHCRQHNIHYLQNPEIVHFYILRILRASS